MVFGQYVDTRALATRGLNVDFNTYSSASQYRDRLTGTTWFLTHMPLIALCNYEGIAEGWGAGQTGPGHAVAENNLIRFDLAVRWKYEFSFFSTLFYGVS